MSEVIKLDTVVVGAGPGGYVAAIRAAQTGQEVAIIEKEDALGGVCLNVGCIPSKALIQAGHAYKQSREDFEVFGVTNEGTKLDFTKTQEWKDNEVIKKMTDGIAFLMKKNNIEVIKGQARLTGTNDLTVTDNDGNQQAYSFNNVILATGSTPIEINGFKFQGRVVDSTGALNFKEVPEKLVVIGGGVIGSELGMAYSNLGSQVTILEGSKQIMPSFAKDLVSTVQRTMKANGITVVTNAMAQEAVDNGESVTVTYEAKGETHQIEADYVLVSVGRRPNTGDIGLDAAGVKTSERGLIEVDEQGRTNISNIYAIGDIVAGAALAHKASYEGVVAAEAIAGKDSVVNYKSMPQIAYTDPEIAAFGTSVKEAKDQGIKTKNAKFLLGANGRAVTMGQANGFVRLIAREEDNVIIGGEMVGPCASDVMQEVGLAIEKEVTLEELTQVIHGHPTLAEAIKDAAESVLGTPLNS